MKYWNIFIPHSTIGLPHCPARWPSVFTKLQSFSCGWLVCESLWKWRANQTRALFVCRYCEWSPWQLSDTSQLVFCQLNFQSCWYPNWICDRSRLWHSVATYAFKAVNTNLVKEKLNVLHWCRRLNLNISICPASELLCLLCDAAVETLMVCLIFTSVPPAAPSPPLPAVWSQALSTCEMEGCTGRPGLYILSACSVFTAGYTLKNMSVSVIFFPLSHLCHDLFAVHFSQFPQCC